MEKKKVLFLLEAFDKGGIEKVTLDIVNNLDPEKYEITVQTFWYGGHCQSQVKKHVKVVPFFFKRHVRGINRLIEYLPAKWLHRLFVRGKYDVEIAASDGGAAKVISGSSNKKARKVCWVHMDVVERGSKLKEFKDATTGRKIYERFDLIVPVSYACKDKFIEKFGNDYPIEVIYNPIPVDQILTKAQMSTASLPMECVNFVCLGRLVEQKGFDRLLEACKQLRDESPCAFHITILGEGPMRSQLEEMQKKFGLEGIVDFLGYSDNPYPWLKAADVFLLSSRDEAFPLVVGESLVIGTPVIATDCAGIQEWLLDDRYGMLVENSIAGIVKGMRCALEKPYILNMYRKRLPEVLEARNFEQSLRNFEKILR